MCHARQWAAIGESTRLPPSCRTVEVEAWITNDVWLPPHSRVTRGGVVPRPARLAAAAAEATPPAYLRAVAALCGDRLLVPVVATATRLGETVAGLTSDKEAEMSVVTLQARDGRRALLAFTGLDSPELAADARPVPVTVDLAAQTARNEVGQPCSSMWPGRIHWRSKARFLASLLRAIDWSSWPRASSAG